MILLWVPILCILGNRRNVVIEFLRECQHLHIIILTTQTVDYKVPGWETLDFPPIIKP